MLRAETEIHAVVGLGPIGRSVTDELVSRGLRVRAIARHQPSDLPQSVEYVNADVTEEVAARRAVTGVSVVYHAASAPYDRWPELLPPIMRGVIAGASAAGARVIYADNLYAYGPVDGPLTEDLPARATGPNGRVRVALAEELLSAHAAGTLETAIGRAADYYGPRGRQSHAGERLFAPALAGKPAQFIGSPDMPHTFTYLRDFARGLVTLGTNEQALGEVWHLPSAETLRTRDFIDLVYEAAGHPPRVRVMPPAILAILALVSPTLRAVREQRYQVERPFVVDHSKFANAFGATVTPHREAIAATLEWFRTSASAGA